MLLDPLVVCVWGFRLFFVVLWAMTVGLYVSIWLMAGDVFLADLGGSGFSVLSSVRVFTFFVVLCRFDLDCVLRFLYLPNNIVY